MKKKLCFFFFQITDPCTLTHFTMCGAHTKNLFWYFQWYLKDTLFDSATIIYEKLTDSAPGGQSSWGTVLQGAVLDMIIFGTSDATFKLISVIKSISVTESIPWLRCACSNVLM